MRDRSKMLTIAHKVEAKYDAKKPNELRFKHLNHNILGYIEAGINFLKLSQGVNGTKESTK
jgi:hypothetical protein